MIEGVFGVLATFFVTGADMVEAPGAALRLVAAGHDLGSHTYSHRQMILRSQAFCRSEVERTDECGIKADPRSAPLSR